MFKYRSNSPRSLAAAHAAQDVRRGQEEIREIRTRQKQPRRRTVAGRGQQVLE